MSPHVRGIFVGVLLMLVDVPVLIVLLGFPVGLLAGVAVGVVGGAIVYQAYSRS